MTFRILESSRNRVRATNHPKTFLFLAHCTLILLKLRMILYEITTHTITHLSHAMTLCRPEIRCSLSKSSSNWNQKVGFLTDNLLSVTFRNSSAWDTLQILTSNIFKYLTIFDYIWLFDLNTGKCLEYPQTTYWSQCHEPNHWTPVLPWLAIYSNLGFLAKVWAQK